MDEYLDKTIEVLPDTPYGRVAEQWKKTRRRQPAATSRARLPLRWTTDRASLNQGK
jgi:hypothetical protein